MLEERYEISSKAKKSVTTLLILGVALLAFGIFGLSQGWFDPANEVHHTTHDVAHEEVAHADAGHHADDAHHSYHWFTRIKANLWLNNVYFIGISIVGIFFLCVQYVAWAGWSAAIKRVFESLGYYLYVGAPLTIIIFFLVYHDVFHWTHGYLTDPESEHFDAIIASKTWYLNMPFYIGRMLVFLGLWVGLFTILRKYSLLEDEDIKGSVKYHDKMINLSAIFLVIFGVSSSMAAWDWIMSIDTHWFSTLFGWYAFASWFVAALSTITLVIIYLKEAGYLKAVNANHLHDLGKFMFAFSIFWTYLWFSQFLLIWYSNIPEEGIWFAERLFYNDGVYLPVFVINLVVNFLFPFLFLMTRDAKRQMILLKVAAFGLIGGHWFDFYLMIFPGVLKNHGGLNLGTIFVELGTTLVFASLFIFSIMKGLSKAPLIAKNHPMLEESLNHHI